MGLVAQLDEKLHEETGKMARDNCGGSPPTTFLAKEQFEWRKWIDLRRLSLCGLAKTILDEEALCQCGD